MDCAVTLVADRQGNLSGATTGSLESLGLEQIDGLRLQDVFDDWQQVLNAPLGLDAKLKLRVSRTKQLVNASIAPILIDDNDYLLIAVDRANYLDTVSITQCHAEKINSALATPFVIDKCHTPVSCSIGTASYHNNVEERRDTKRIVSDRMQRADSTMYSVKKETDIGGSRGTSSRLVRDIYTAIAQNDLFMEYQPQVETQTNVIVGYEGLVRWQHPINGTVGPGHFVPLIESTGAMTQLTTWITRHICFDYINNLAIHSCEIPPSVSINLSAIQLQDKRILKIFDKIIQDEKVDPSNVVFEITESALISDPVAGRESLLWLHNNGYRVALDDFGTGYSSLSYLNQFPIDELKLDCSFIRDIETKESARTLVSGIIQLAHRLDLIVTAEGVEEPAQLKFLLEHGCDRWQGFLKSKACSPAKIVEMRSAA